MGRPAQHPDLFKIPVSYKLPRWLVEWLRDQDRPQAQLIEEAEDEDEDGVTVTATRDE